MHFNLTLSTPPSQAHRYSPLLGKTNARPAPAPRMGGLTRDQLRAIVIEQLG